MPVDNPSRDVSDLVARIYEDVLGRAPDPAGAAILNGCLAALASPCELGIDVGRRF